MSKVVCDECTRADALRAVAGRGLPAIEDGHADSRPGTGLSRRGFVARSLGLALTVYGAGRLDVFDEGIAAAATMPKNPILVSVFLQGGADALSLLSPQADPLYRKLRPNLAVSGGTVFAEDDRLFWHPALDPIAQLHGEGKVTVLPAVGYDHPDQSHFTSRHFWEVGATDSRLLTGWLGRYLDAVGSPDNPLQGLSLTGSLEPALATAKVPVAAIDGPGQYDFWSPGVWGEVEDRDARGDRHARQRRWSRRGLAHGGEGERAVRDAPPPAAAVRRQEAHAARAVSGRATTPFPQSLQGLAAMIAAGLPLRCVALEATGEYDTHAEPGVGARAGADDDRRVALLVPARSRGARRRRPRAHARLDGVRPARRGERLGRHRPRRRRHRRS